MSKEQNKELKFEIQFVAIEILDFSLTLPKNRLEPLDGFNFALNIETRPEKESKQVFVILKIEIKDKNQIETLGTITVSCIFNIVNFEDVLVQNDKGLIELPKQLIEVLNSMTISTTRGVMFANFKGTFLHNAVLPIIDPKSLNTVQ